MAAAPPPPSPDPAVMIDDIVEEFLLRLTPEDPELLARAALVSRQWYRVVTGPSFRRRFRELDRSTPLLLGYVLNLDDSVRFVPLPPLRPPGADRQGVQAVCSSHGRVLLHRLSEKDRLAQCRPVQDVEVHLSVWDPITGEQEDLPVVPLRLMRYKVICNWDAAVICAVGDGCNHLHCHFKVVFMGNHQHRMFSCFYSSETGSWSDPVFTSEEYSHNTFSPGQCIPIGTALYTCCGCIIFKYDLRTHQMCNISITPTRSGRLIAAEDGRLGFAEGDKSLRLWLWENGRWEESRVIDLHTLVDALQSPPVTVSRVWLGPLNRVWVGAFADTGAGVIFLWTHLGYFTVDLKSGSWKKIGEVSEDFEDLVPYVSFCTPVPAAGVVISSDEVPVADIAVSTDEGPGAGVGVVVYADEGPGAAVASA